MQKHHFYTEKHYKTAKSLKLLLFFNFRDRCKRGKMNTFKEINLSELKISPFYFKRLACTEC